MTPATPEKLHPLAVLGRADHIDMRRMRSMGNLPQGGLQGYCHTTFSTLVALLGEPHVHRGDKTNVEWAFRCNDGTIFTVYDWKLPSVPVSEYRWHIGGTGRPLQAFIRHTGLKAVPCWL